MHWETRMRDLAQAQEGLVGKLHLPAISCDRREWWRAQHNGRWDVLSERVIRLRGSPNSDGQRALAAVLDASPGAVLHGASALGWLQLPGFNLSGFHVARPRWLNNERPATLAKLHLLRDLHPHHIAVVRGVPTETAVRAIWTEAARFSPEPRYEMGLTIIGGMLDAAHRKGLVTWAGLREMVEDIQMRGRAGTVLMRELSLARPPGSSPTETRQEDRFEEILSSAKLRPMVRQVVLGGHEPIGRCDFRDEKLPFAAEVNSLTFHTTPSDRAADELRYRRLNDAGFTVAVIWEDDLWKYPAGVVETINLARLKAMQRERVTLHSPHCPWPDPSGSGPGSVR